MNIIIRHLIKQDIEEIIKFLPEMWFMHSSNSNLVSEEKLKEIKPEEYLEEITQEKNQYGFVAIIQDKIIGFVKCKKKKCPDFYKENYELYIDDLIVSKDYRKKGIATKLINKCISLAREQNINLITSKIWKFNKNSELLFKKIGFKEDYSFYSYQI